MSSSSDSEDSDSSECSDDDGEYWKLVLEGAKLAYKLIQEERRKRHHRDGSQILRYPFQELTGLQWVTLKLSKPSECYKNFRMTPRAFHALHSTLKQYGLHSTREVNSKEVLGMFLWTCGTAQSQSQICERFRRSPDTVHLKFRHILKVMLQFSKDIIQPRDPDFRDVHERLLQARFFPHFVNCVGAIDGTHIPVVVPQEERMTYMCRHGYTSQNVMAVCDFDMRFTFVAAGMKGRCHDMAVFKHAVRGEKSHLFPHPPHGTYMCVYFCNPVTIAMLVYTCVLLCR